jgi:hypothetical protein
MIDRISDQHSARTICVRDTEIAAATASKFVFLAAAHPKGVVTAKYITRLFVRIVIISQICRADLVTLRACRVERKADISEQKQDVWQNKFKYVHIFSR